jgi:RNA-directed DNA polymerase
MGSMFDALCDWSNLLQAWRLAARGKRRRPDVARFEHLMADQMLHLGDALAGGTWRPGRFHRFAVHDPKPRIISAAPFADRVVHHALCRVCEPVFEAHFHPHSYANRPGLGTHRAVKHLQHAARTWRYALRCDVRQHFPSIDHARLRAKLAKLLGDEQVLALVDLILASGAEPGPAPTFLGDDLFAVLRPHGLPIGNLTSQMWSNVYLSDFDWFVWRELGCRGYLRYVDDFVLLSDSKAQLALWRTQLIERLAKERLRLHETSAQVVPTGAGIPWLGFVVYPQQCLLKRRRAVGFTRHLRALLRDWRAGTISFATLDASVQGWIAHAAQADTWGLREYIFSHAPLRGAAGEASPVPPPEGQSTG